MKPTSLPLIVSHNNEGQEALDLRQEFLDSLGELSSTLRDVVSRLYALGATRDDLVSWAVAAGYSKGFVRSLLSQLFCDAGHRARRPGAGRRTPQEALDLLALASDRYGERASRYLLAAYRAAKAQQAATVTQPPPAPSDVPNVLVLQQSSRPLSRNSTQTFGSNV